MSYCIHMDHILIVGASLAGLRAAEGIRRAGHTGVLRIVGDEAEPPYDRTTLSKEFLGGGLVAERFALRQAKNLDADWLCGVRATGLDTGERRVVLADGSSLRYDGLVIATGAEPRQLPCLPTSVPGVHTLRTLRDATALRAALVPGARVVIVGAGFIGTELASACRARGLDTTVVSPQPLLGTALGELSTVMAARVRRHGVTLLDDTSVVGLEADDRVRAVRLSGGGALPADVVVVAVGAVPATGWLTGSGVKLDGGVLCDETMAVRDLHGVVAAGDVARWPHPALGGATVRLEHWTNTAEQAVAAGRRLVTGTGPAFAPVPSFWSDQFGITLHGVGFPSMADHVVFAEGTPDGDAFAVEYHSGGQLVGAVVAGGTKPLLRYRKELARLERYPG